MHAIYGRHIRGMMGLAEVTQEELAAASGVHVSTINIWLARRGQLIPGRVSTIKKVLAALESMGVKLDFAQDGAAIISEFNPNPHSRQP